jgi:hypothetical protein
LLTPAIPPIVLPQGGFTKIEREWLERWQDRVKEDHVFVICNKMDLVQVEDNGAMIPREEAIQIYFDHNPMFARFSADDPGPSGRGAMVQMMTASMTDAELDNSARPYRKPDTTALKQELEAEIRKIFPRMPPTDPGKPPKFIHFIDAAKALRGQTGGDGASPEFNEMRKRLFAQLRKDHARLTIEKPLQMTAMAGQQLVAYVRSSSPRPSQLYIWLICSCCSCFCYLALMQVERKALSTSATKKMAADQIAACNMHLGQIQEAMDTWSATGGGSRTQSLLYKHGGRKLAELVREFLQCRRLTSNPGKDAVKHFDGPAPSEEKVLDKGGPVCKMMGSQVVDIFVDMNKEKIIDEYRKHSSDPFNTLKHDALADAWTKGKKMATEFLEKMRVVVAKDFHKEISKVVRTFTASNRRVFLLTAERCCLPLAVP